jgi:GNAT superfamily N-acetyltransferase
MSQRKIQVRQLSAELLPDFLTFFDGTAFSDNPKWSSCYCQCYYEDHSVVKWSERTASQNRGLACERINGRSMQGYLAYSDGAPVGWCNAAPRHLLRALDDEPIPDAGDVGMIICFLVEPSHRGRGVARALLDAACDGLHYKACESRKAIRESIFLLGEPLRSAQLYQCGFAVHRQDDDGSVYVRKAL